jgi:tRNA A37 threonylcarbamoyladenosine synthetase subunit TsaC/SUA5/YrdC
MTGRDTDDKTGIARSAAEEAFRAVADKDGLALVAANVGYSLLGTSRASIEKMYRIKGRVYGNPCIAAGTMEVFDSIIRPPGAALRAWVADVAGWAPVAVVGELDEDAPAVRRLDPWVLDHCRVDGTMAVFLNTGPFVERMVELAQRRGILLVGSSGNLSGHGNNYTYQDVPARILDEVDYAIDLGPAHYINDEGRATTIVDLTSYTVRRRGVRAEEIIDSYARMAAVRGDLPAELTVLAR